VDVFDALTSQRPYKKAYSYAESINILRKGSGSHFDPELLHVFDQIAEDHYLQLKSIKTEDSLSKKLDLLMKDYFIF
jgi:HD-GYP domain-containing protein (c-di-GMP phosphodiesterase class II)